MGGSLFRWIAFWGIFLVSMPSVSWSSEGEESKKERSIGPIVVTATRTEVPLGETAGSVTVIQGRQLRERQMRTVADVLREVAGLDVVQQGGPGSLTNVFLRGSNSSQTVVLIDGIQVNSPLDGAFNFADLTVESIDKIEIVRGPQSMLYGSEAIGGVIHIFTRKGKGPTRGSITLEGGSFRTFRETMGFRGASEMVQYSVSASRLDSQGISRANEDNGNSEADAYENSTFAARIGVKPAKSIQVDWTARLVDSSSDLDGCDPVTFFCPADDLDFRSDARTLVTGLGLSGAITDWLTQEVKLSLNQEEFRGSDSTDPFNNFEFRTQGRRLDIREVLSLGKVDRLTLGYEYESVLADSVGNFERVTANSAIYAMNEVRILPVILNLGGRWDDNNRFGSETTYKAEIAFLISATGTKVRGAYGTGFRGPTLSDLFFPGFSNPNLEPERSKSAEVGIEQVLGDDRFRAVVTYFDTRVDDLIVFDFLTSKPQNVDEARMKGTEVELALHPVRALRMAASYTKLDAENRTTGFELARRPENKAAGSLTWQPVAFWRLVGEGRYVGKRFSDIDNTVKLGDHTVANLATWYEVNSQLEFFVRIENLFDREYEEVAGFGTPGRAGYGGVQMTF